MLSEPNPILNEKEQSLLDFAPEECLKHAVQRGALALDEMLSNPSPNLSPHVVAVVRSIATGERLSLPERREPNVEAQECGWALNVLAVFPQLSRLLRELALTPDEAMEAAHAIDDILGRYMTGTKYAAP